VTSIVTQAEALPDRLDGRSVRAWTPWETAPRATHIDPTCEACKDPGPPLIAFGTIDGPRHPVHGFAAFQCSACGETRIYRMGERPGEWAQVAYRAASSTAAGRDGSVQPDLFAMPLTVTPAPAAASARVLERGTARCALTACGSGERVRRYVTGLRCWRHSPAAVAGELEPDELLAQHRARLPEAALCGRGGEP
jgi:hypothetical protein